MAKFVIVSDLHVTERAPSSCTDSYLADILDLLDEVRIGANIAGAAGVVWAGDIFHHKAPSRTSHRLVMAMMRLIDAHHCPVYIVTGNHDIQNDRLDSVNLTQPLGVILRESQARLLDGWGIAESAPLYGVPWQQHWDDEHVMAALADYRDCAAERRGYTLVVTHAPMYPPGLELPFENYPAVRFAAAMGPGTRGSVYYGHVHEAHGTYSAGGVQFCNNGAISRGSLHEHNLTRSPVATIWDSATGEFTKQALNAKPADQVFRLQEHAEVVDMQGRLDEFLAGIGAANLEVVSTESVIAHVRGMGLDADVQSLIEELVEEASNG